MSGNLGSDSNSLIFLKTNTSPDPNSPLTASGLQGVQRPAKGQPAHLLAGPALKEPLSTAAIDQYYTSSPKIVPLLELKMI